MGCTIQFADGSKCGKPAVDVFVGRSGEKLAECADHFAGPSAPVAAPRAAIEAGDVVEVVHIGIVKRGVVVRVGRTGSGCIVEVPIRGGAATKHIERRVADVVVVR